MGIIIKVCARGKLRLEARRIKGLENGAFPMRGHSFSFAKVRERPSGGGGGYIPEAAVSCKIYFIFFGHEQR